MRCSRTCVAHQSLDIASSRQEIGPRFVVKGVVHLTVFRTTTLIRPLLHSSSLFWWTTCTLARLTFHRDHRPQSEHHGPQRPLIARQVRSVSEALKLCTVTIASFIEALAQTRTTTRAALLRCGLLFSGSENAPTILTRLAKLWEVPEESCFRESFIVLFFLCPCRCSRSGHLPPVEFSRVCCLAP